jgi:hypothetical protein
LQAGDYQISFSDQARVLGSTDVSINAQQWSDATVNPPSVTVSGRILFNGKPPDSPILLGFRGRAIETGQTLVSTDPSGYFDASLPKPGIYSLQAKISEHMSTQSKAVTLQEGPNIVEWDLLGGVLKIFIDGWDGSLLQLILSGPKSHAGVVTSDSPREPIIAFALPFGSYQVTASSPPRTVTRDPRTVHISDGNPVAEVHLSLAENDTLLYVRDAVTGSPVSMATARASVRTLKESTTPGAYEMVGIPPGTPVTVAAQGYSPACRRALLQEPIDVALVRGDQQATIRYSEDMRGPVGRVIGIPGSNCAIELTLFAVSRISSKEFAVHNLPPLPGLALEVGGSVYPLSPTWRVNVGIAR